MVLPLIPPSPREGYPSPHTPSPSPWSPGISYLPDFDPVTGWLIDPEFHFLPMMAPEEPPALNSDWLDVMPVAGLCAPGELLDEKMEETCLVDSSDNRSGKMDEEDELEEGEIRNSSQEDINIFGHDDDDEEVAAVGPIRSKNEIDQVLPPAPKVEVCLGQHHHTLPVGVISSDLPPVPQVEVCLGQHHHTLPVGVISYIMGTIIIVEGLHQHSHLNEGSVLWITETRLPLGLVDAIFGPIKRPYYVVRHNIENKMPVGINVGTAVSFVMEFANYILNEKDLYKKGYGASGMHDEEVFVEVEFSDDDEAEYRRSLQQPKRAASNMGHRDQDSAFDMRGNSKGSCTRNQEFARDKRTAKLKDGPANDRRRDRNQESAVDKRAISNNAAASGGRNGNQQYRVDRTNLRGALTQNCKPCGPLNQPVPRIPGSSCEPLVTAKPLVTANFDLGSCTPLVRSGMTPVGSTPAIAPKILQALQLIKHYGNPTQQLLLQQANALIPHGFPPEQHNMSPQGGVGMNALSSHQMGNTSCNQLQKNQFINSFAGALPFQQQFIPNHGAAANFPRHGPLNLAVGPRSLGAVGQSSMGQASFGCCNVHGQGDSSSCSVQSCGQPPSASIQGRMGLPVLGQSNIARGSVGFSSMQEQGVSGSWNAKSFIKTPPSSQGIGHPSMQLNPSIYPASLRPVGQTAVGQAPSGHSTMSERGVPGSCNAKGYSQPPAINQGMYPMQSDPSNDPKSLASTGHSSISRGRFGCSEMLERGSSGSCTSDNYGLCPPAINQHSFVRPVGQSSIGRVPFRCRNMRRKVHPTRRPPSFRGRKHHLHMHWK